MKNNAASVLARLKNMAKKDGIAYSELLIRYGIERVLKRLELSSYASKCILKGGTMFIVWNGGFSYRPTMDADIEYRGIGTPEELKKVFLEVASVEGCEDDALVISKETIEAVQIREGDDYGGVRVSMTAYIGAVRVPVQFDVGVGDVVTPRAKLDEFPVLLDHSTPRLRVYPRETMIAEKFQTIVSRGVANSRMKDYFDLWKLSEDKAVDCDVAKLAIVRTFARRKTELPRDVPEGLTEVFWSDKNKIAQWRGFVKKNHLADQVVEFQTVVEAVREFIWGRIMQSVCFNQRKDKFSRNLTDFA